MEKTSSEDDAVWPTGFMDVGGKSFRWVYTNKPVFVDFTLTEMKNATKWFARWKAYCCNKTKTKHD